ncbi:helix-turn-helix domain-containing protein [Klebsiella pneumoniae]|uniref:helix-turn-helix domain-containing protein n=1 Tax=Klebsiella pneumoniae TaxID=573 RepID=UPI00148618A1
MRAPSPKRAKAIALRAEGLTMQEIAAKLGINRGTVSKWLAKERFKTQANELDRLISDAQAKYDSLPPSEAERLRDLRDSLREQQQVIIKRQIKLLESVQGEAMTALRSWPSCKSMPPTGWPVRSSDWGPWLTLSRPAPQRPTQGECNERASAAVNHCRAVQHDPQGAGAVVP